MTQPNSNHLLLDDRLTPHYQTEAVTVYHGDCVEVMAQLADSSVDAVVTDPPYGLEFMGKEWDSFKGTSAAHANARTLRADEIDDRSKGKYIRFGVNAYEAGKPFQQWCQTWVGECLRVLKPGGYMLAFGGTRTFHRLACAVEDAGFEIRDSLAWIYGSGFPKSLDVSKAIDKSVGAEREIIGERKLTGTARRTADGRSHGAARTNSASPQERVETFEQLTVPATDAAKQWQGWGTALKPAFEPIVVARKPLCGTVAENVQRWGTGAINVDGCRVPHGDDVDLNAVHRQNSSDNPIRFGAKPGYVIAMYKPGGRWPPNVVLDEAAAAELDQQSGEGGASRFFPVFKYTPKAPQIERPSVDGVAHPTCKPLELMKWLVRLVTPPHGVVLDPFAGTGTTAEACIHEHKRAIVIEREAEYLPLIVARLHKPIQVGFDF